MKNNVIITTYLEMRDPQRNNIVLSDYSRLLPLINSAVKNDYKLIILYKGNIDEEFINNQPDNIEFVEVDTFKEFNVYINRLIIMYNYLKDNIDKFDKVLLCDGTDVILLKPDIFKLTWYNLMQVGSETHTLGIQWILLNSQCVFKDKDILDWYTNNLTKKLLNCGLIMGNINNVLDILLEMINIFNKYCKNTDQICDMFTFNYVMYNSKIKFATDTPFHTEFKKYDLNNKICYIAHK